MYTTILKKKTVHCYCYNPKRTAILFLKMLKVVKYKNNEDDNVHVFG